MSRTFHKKHILGCFLTLLCQVAGAAPKTPQWAELARRDLQQIHTLISTQTPLPIVGQPAARSWLKKGLQRALSLANTASSYQDYFFALKYYTNGFHDPLIDIYPKRPFSHQAVSWPGFIVRYQEKKFIVGKVMSSWPIAQPAVHAEIVRCDGIAINLLVKKRIFNYAGYEHNPSDWQGYAPLLWTQGMLPSKTKAIRHCTFRYQGKTTQLPLQWQPIQAKTLTIALRKTLFAYEPTLGIKPLGKTGVWLSLGTFAPQDARQQTALVRLIASLRGEILAKPIVIDLRGNGGGADIWGQQLLRTLFRPDYYTWVQHKRSPMTMVWRVSTANKQYLKKELLSNIPQAEQGGSFDKALRTLLKEMGQAQKNHKQIIKKRIAQPKLTKHDKPPVNWVKGKVYLVTDGRCAGTCVTFVADALRFPNVIQVGEATDLETRYNVQRHVLLRSRQANLGFPMRFLQGGTTRHHKAYHPRYLFPGNINDTASLMTWILQLEDKD